MMDLSCATSYLQAGLCVLPASLKEKRPAVPRWKPFCGRLPTLQELEAWFTEPRPACVLAGSVSGNLELLDFDHRGELFDQWAEAVAKESEGLLERLLIETSQSGGRHVIYRSSEPVSGNRKLAQRIIPAKSGDAMIVDGKSYVPRKTGDRYEVTCTLIETRGEGGLFLCSPTPGYELHQGAFNAIPVLDSTERAILVEAACSLNELIPTPEPFPELCNGSRRPGDDFNERGDFKTLLRRHGWTRIRSGENEQWRRPGKQLGCSATLKANTLFVFSSNAAPFEPDRAYSPFAAYALLEHGGDFQAAAVSLRAEGYGGELEEANNSKQAEKRRRPPAPPVSRPDLPSIVIDGRQLSELTDQAMAAVGKANSPPTVFVRSGTVARIMRDEHGVPRIEPFDRVRMRCRLSEVANFFTLRKGEGGSYDRVGTHPPLSLAENVLAQTNWNLPPLAGIARAPILRHDGSICTQPGYDPISRLYYCPDPGLKLTPIPEYPDSNEVQACVDILQGVISDFPFADDASRANALGILFTLLMRPVISGHVPLAIVDAPMQGTGKTLLVTALATIAVGNVASESIPSRGNDDEWRKKITSIMLVGSPFVLLDNIPDNTTIESPSLAALLTSDEWADRLLGRNDAIRLPAKTVWAATGNNLRVTGDMPRRSYSIRLDANTERPWERTTFKIRGLIQHVLSNRGDLLSAALTIIRAWYTNRQPIANVPSLGGFEAWARAVGSVLAFAGIDGFLGNLDRTQVTQDEDTQQWTAFFDAWWEAFESRSVTVDDLCQQILTHAGVPEQALPDSLVVQRDRGEGALRRSLGRHLSRLTGRIFNGHKLLSVGTDRHRKVRCWKLAGLITPQPDTNPATNPAQKELW
ncbi:MAG: hypothetical protein RIS70_1225 [Planctomycetota bacterium]|jgi:hypothetical protein